MLQPRNQQQLEDEGGFSIVSTHFGKGYVRNGEVVPEIRALLLSLARRPGWFPTTGTLLDWLREERECGPLPRQEWKVSFEKR